VRPSGRVTGSYTDEGNYVADAGPIQSVVTSGGQNDSGTFELNLRDDRYLPFEGAGAISTWQIALPVQYPQFDYATIADVVIHLRYTSRESDALRDEALGALTGALNSMRLGREADRGLYRLLSARHEFPNEWARFLQPPPAATAPAFQFALDKGLFPFAFRAMKITLAEVRLFPVVRSAGPLPATRLLAPGATDSPVLGFAEGDDGLLQARQGLTYEVPPPPDFPASPGDGERWRLVLDQPSAWRGFAERVDDILMAFGYTVG
jgi:hypothetical protein